MYNLNEPNDALKTAEVFPDINSVPKGTTVTVDVPETSLTMYIRSPTVFKEGSGRVRVVSRVPVIATMSSVGWMAYVEAAALTTARTFDGSKVREPSPAVFKTVPLEGATVGQLKFPIFKLDALEGCVIEAVTTLPQEIFPDIPFINTKQNNTVFRVVLSFFFI